MGNTAWSRAPGRSDDGAWDGILPAGGDIMDARRMVVSLGALALTACETNRNETRPEDLARAAFVDGGNACTRVLCRAETYFGIRRTARASSPVEMRTSSRRPCRVRGSNRRSAFAAASVEACRNAEIGGARACRSSGSGRRAPRARAGRSADVLHAVSWELAKRARPLCRSLDRVGPEVVLAERRDQDRGLGGFEREIETRARDGEPDVRFELAQHARGAGTDSKSASLARRRGLAARRTR